MNRLLISILPLLLANCSTTIEKMDKNTDTGDHYVWVHSQWGGQSTWQNSMGSAGANDMQKSFADLMQMVATVKGLDAATKQLLFKEVTKRYQMGQITQQQKIAADLAIAQSSSAGELQIALAQIAKGP